MKLLKTKIDGPKKLKTTLYKDNRGYLKEVYQKKIIDNLDFPFDIMSYSKKNVLRGLHIQTKKPQAKIITVTHGKILDVAVDLRKILNKLVTAHYEDTVVMGEMTVELRPLTYKEFTSAALKTFEEQRIFQTINDDSIPDAEKLTAFSDSFAMLTDLTVSMLAKGVIKVTIGDTEVTNPDHISEFISNVDKEFYQTILDHLDAQKQKFGIEPFKVDSSDDDVAAGAPKTFEVPITFDQSNFFA